MALEKSLRVVSCHENRAHHEGDGAGVIVFVRKKSMSPGESQYGIHCSTQRWQSEQKECAQSDWRSIDESRTLAVHVGMLQAMA